MRGDFKADIARYRQLESSFLYLLFEQGLWAVGVYRFGRWARTVRVPVLGQILRIFAFLWFKTIEIYTGISLPASAQIGPGFYVGHFSGIILHSDVVMGKHCSIGPGVLIGSRGGGRQGVPVIGDNVYIGVGAKVLGPVKIGSNVNIGANAVVLSDVPDGATAVGIPARLVEKK